MRHVDVLKTSGIKEVSIMAKLMHTSCDLVGYLPRLTLRCSVGD